MKRWIVLSVLLVALAGCTPDKLVITGTLTDQNGGLTGDFEITNALTEVYTTGSAEAVFKVKAVTKRGRVLPLRKWRCTKQIGLTTTMVAQGNQKQVEDEVEISIPLLDGQGRGQNIGISFSATTWRKEQTFMLTSIDAGMVTLTTAREGQGSVSPEAGPHRYLPGMYVALEATPDAGWQFVGWQGNVVDTASSATGITLGSADETVTAFFEKKVQPGTRAALYLTRNSEGLVVDFYLGDRPMPDTWEGLPQGVGFSNVSGLGLVALPQDMSRRYFEFLPVEPLDPVAVVSCDSASIDTDSSNNVYIAYSVNEGEYSNIYLLNKNSGEPEKLLEGGFISGLKKNYTKPAIKIDSNNNYHIAYIYNELPCDPEDITVCDNEGASQYVRVITNTTGNSTSGKISVEATGVIGANGLAMDGSNNAYVVYTIDSSVLEAKISGENSWDEYAVTSGSDIPASISADGSSIGIAYSASDSIRYKDDLGNGSYSSVTLIDEGTNPVLVLNTNKYVYYEKGGNIWLATDKDIPDVTAPVITLLGSSPVDVTVDETYTDAGVTALDETDGDITASVVTTGTVDTAIAGTYTITYNVSDTAGNPAPEVTRTVNVVPVTPPGGGGGTTYHTIKATASENGSITPSGYVSVPAGSNQIFTITANAGYKILDVLVDSISKGVIETYTFENITEGHTISASFVSTTEITVSDINKDGVVNEYDLALLMLQWGKTGSNLSADLNKDGVVNEYDFAILMLNWTL
jgi:hypothetical protein